MLFKFIKKSPGVDASGLIIESGGQSYIVSPPLVIIDNQILMPKASSVADGYLSKEDYASFAAKQIAGNYLQSVAASAPLSGAGTPASPLAIDLSNYATKAYVDDLVAQLEALIAALGGTIGHQYLTLPTLTIQPMTVNEQHLSSQELTLPTLAIQAMDVLLADDVHKILTLATLLIKSMTISFSPLGTPSYDNVGGKGDRTSIITVSTNLSYDYGTPSGMVDGLFSGMMSGIRVVGSQDVTDKYIKFDFGSPVFITEARQVQDFNNTHGYWKWQGSYNGDSWADIGSSFLMGGGAGPDSNYDNKYMQAQTELFYNDSGYRYYRLLGVPGYTDGINTWFDEFEFNIVDV